MKKYIIYVLIIQSPLLIGMDVSDETRKSLSEDEIKNAAAQKFEQKIKKRVFRAVNASLKNSDSMSITSSGEFSIEDLPSKNTTNKGKLRDPFMASEQSISFPKRASSMEKVIQEQKEKELKELEEKGIKQKTFLAILSK